MSELLTLEKIAELLGMTRVRVRDTVVKRPDFPRPAVHISQKTRRWLKSDVERWITTH